MTTKNNGGPVIESYIYKTNVANFNEYMSRNTRALKKNRKRIQQRDISIKFIFSRNDVRSCFFFQISRAREIQSKSSSTEFFPSKSVYPPVTFNYILVFEKPAQRLASEKKGIMRGFAMIVEVRTCAEAFVAFSPLRGLITRAQRCGDPKLYAPEDRENAFLKLDI